MEPIYEKVTGARGTAEPCPLDGVPDSSATVAVWLLTCPGRHPVWSQWALSAVTLAPVDGYPPAKITVEGATHELLLFAIEPQIVVDPNARLWEPRDVGEFAKHMLTPVNIVEQVRLGSDEQARELTSLLAQAVAHGVLDPETADSPERTRRYWSSTIARTIEHHRGHRDGRC